jgi:hypothetical protein
MNKLIEVNNSEPYSKLITLQKEYKGHVIRRVHDKYTDFQYVVKPCADISSFIIYVDDTIIDDTSYSGCSKYIRNDIEKAIHYLVDVFKQENINIIGVELLIHDFVVHDVDYRGHFFLTNFVGEFRKLLYQKGLKILNKNQYQIAEQKYEPNIKPTNYIEEDLNQFLITTHPQISFNNRGLRLLTDIVESIDFCNYNNYSDYIKYCLTFRIRPIPINYYGGGVHKNSISVKCKFERKHIEINSYINDALKNFIAELEEDNIYLGGFYMEFDFEITPPPSETSQFYGIQNAEEYTSIIHWKFKEIFMKYGAIYE